MKSYQRNTLLKKMMLFLQIYKYMNIKKEQDNYSEIYLSD